LRSNTKGYGGKSHWTDSQDSNTTVPSGRELLHLQFSLQVASLETFGYTLLDKTSGSVFHLPMCPCPAPSFFSSLSVIPSWHTIKAHYSRSQA
jgi:hypothetical protein